MITREELGALEPVVGFNLWQLEKDYLQHLVLLFLYERAVELVFKGGTALQKTFGLGRFSIDLDFTATAEFDLELTFRDVAAKISAFGFAAALAKTMTKEREWCAWLKIRGPLWDGTDKTLTTLRIEISRRRDLVLKPEAIEIVPVYTDLRPYTVIAMAREESLAEKVRALLWRARARDVYDMFFILRKGIRPDTALIEKKLEYYGLKYSKSALLKRVEDVRPRWHAELGHLLRTVPDFETVKEELADRL